MPSDPAAPAASIVVPTRARLDYLQVALASIAPQARAVGAEAIVVDDAGPSREARELVEGLGVLYVAHPAPLGLNVARNTGIARACGEMVVFVDDDVQARAGWLAALLHAARAHPDVDVFTGPIHARLEGRPPHSCGREPPPITALDLGGEDARTRFAWGANMAIRRSALERVGPFDVSLQHGGDEQEWQERLGSPGAMYVAAAALDHRRKPADARLRPLCRAAYVRGRAARRFDAWRFDAGHVDARHGDTWRDARRGDDWRGHPPSLASELRTLAGCLGHVVRRRCPMGLTMVAHSWGRLREAIASWGRVQAGGDQTGEGRAGRDQAGGDQTGRDQTGRDQASGNQAGRDQAGRDQTSGNQARRDQAGRDQTSGNQTGRDQAGRDQTSENQAGRDQAGRDQTSGNQAGRDQAGEDQAGALTCARRGPEHMWTPPPSREHPPFLRNDILLSRKHPPFCRKRPAHSSQTPPLSPSSAANDDFLSGESGTVGGLDGLRRRALDAGDDVLQIICARPLRLARAARRSPPPRRVLALCVERPENATLTDALQAELSRSRHELQLRRSPAGDAGKFENLNRMLAVQPVQPVQLVELVEPVERVEGFEPVERVEGFGGVERVEGFDWLLVLDDDIVIPRGFLDRFLFLAERFELDVAQPAHRATSHAAWRITRRRRGAVVRETRFVEIGPVTAFARRTFPLLLPFPQLRMGWGLDLHWAAVAAQHGWRCGVIDAVAIAHRAAPAASSYSREQALGEARAFLRERPYLPAAEAQQTLVTHRRW